MSYSIQFYDYFLNTEHAGRLFGNHLKILKHESVSPFDQFRLFLLIDEQIILKARFESSTTPALIAAGEYVCRWLEGKSTQQAQELSAQQILQALDLDYRFSYVADLIHRLVVSQFLAN